MNNINEITISSLTRSSYLKPMKIKYTQNGIDKEADFLKVHNRPAVYYANLPGHEDGTEIETTKYPCEHGFTLELCAGIVDKELPLEDIARIEVLEECGFVVPSSRFEHIISIRNVSLTGSKQAVFYAEVTDEMKSAEPTKEHRTIKVVEVNVEEAKNFLHDSEIRSPAVFLFSLLWFFQNKHR